MIVTEQITINDRRFTKTYSDSGFMVERDGAQYSEAIDPAEFGRTYTETDIPIEGESKSDIEQKAAAFDYLTGRSGGDE
jgi:hypothetical protein